MDNKTIDDKNRDFIDMESTRYATANTYRLDNPYLTPHEKKQVELWFQFPETVMFITLCICMLLSTLSSLPLKWIIGIPLIVDLIIGLINWTVNLRKCHSVFFLTIGNNFALWILALTTIGILIYYKMYLYASIIFIGKLGFLSLISPSMYVYTILSKRYKMHPKWVFFKKFYAMTFPFEKEIERPL